jgi:hypothetical protein
VWAILDPAVVGKLILFYPPSSPWVCLPGSYGWIIILLDSNIDNRKRDNWKIPYMLNKMGTKIIFD